MLFPSRRAGRRGFALLEAMLAVAIFALGVIGLGRCISTAMRVQYLSAENSRICRLLENRAAMIETQVLPLKMSPERIDGINGGVVLTQTATPSRKKDEKGREMGNLFLVNIEASWTSDGERQARSLNIYVQPTNP